MSLGAVFVFFYGYIKLKPYTASIQTQENNQQLIITKFNNKPKITPTKDRFNKINTQLFQNNVQYIELYKFENQFMEILNKNPKTVTANKDFLSKTTTTSDNQNKIQKSQKSSQINSPKEIIQLIEKYASTYGVDKNMMIGIAKCESNFKENAVNGPYVGIYQFVAGTWISNRRVMGLDESPDLRYNAEESIKTAAFKMSRDGFGAWPVCQHKAKDLLASKQ